ncbi:phasin family protein [Telmatospirillum sp. J64-1]|uniref:phasin family protein n=1 Tax=Telmatospirillum sp. J64-1 TaxID=2502183 RepID=UPI00115F4841|nr:phasin family protein [Telmatospirillum sp. J64-1]
MTTAKAKTPVETPTPDAVATAQQAVAQVTKQMEEVVAASRQSFDNLIQSSPFKSYEDMIQFSRDNMEAVSKSGSILAKGLQDLSKTMVGMTQANIEESVSASKQMMSAKTLKELMDLQSSLAKNSIDKLLAESTKLSEMSTKLAEEALAPINSRVSAVTEKLYQR